MDFTNSEQNSKCLLCSKKIIFLTRSFCHLCNNYFCQSCTFTSNLLPKDQNALIFSQKACKICSLVWIIPQLKEEQLRTLPTKLLLVISSVYSNSSSSLIEKSELAQKVASCKFSEQFLNKYYDDWISISKKLTAWTNLLPQFENAVKNYYTNTNSQSAPRSEHVPNSSYRTSQSNNTETSRANHNQALETDSSVFPGINLNNILDPLVELTNSMFESAETGHNNYAYESSINPNNRSSEANHSHSNTSFQSHQPNTNGRSHSNANTTSGSQQTYSYNDNTSSSNHQKTTTSPKAQDVSIQELAAASNMNEKVSSLSVQTLKRVLRDNFVNCDRDIEKSTLINKVNLLINAHKKENAHLFPDDSSVKPKLENHNLKPGFADEDNLCKICFEVPANCVLLECGHTIACVDCGKELMRLNQPCPICRSDIIRVVRIFR